MLTPTQLKKLQKLAKVGDIAIADELNALEGKIEALEAIVPVLREAKDGEVGPMGPRGEKGDSIKGEKGDPGRDGANGKDSTVPGPVGPMGPAGRDGVNGVDGKDGEMGVIDEATIAYLEDEVKKAKLDKEAYDRALGIVDQRTSFLINKVNNLPTSTSTGGGTWGTITGTLSTQTDLQTALDEKFKHTGSEVDIVFAPGSPRQIIIADQTTVDTAGDNLTFKGGAGNGAGDGGNFSLIGGDRGLTGFGGNVYLRGGAGDDAASSGHIQILDPISGFAAIKNTDNLTSNQTFSYPDATGTIALTSDIPVIKDTFGITVDGSGTALTTGSKGFRYIEQDCTITGWVVQSDISGDVIFDVKRGGVSLSGSEKPTLAAATSASNVALTTWTTSLIAGDIIEFVIDSASTLTRATLTVLVTKI